MARIYFVMGPGQVKHTLSKRGAVNRRRYKQRKNADEEKEARRATKAISIQEAGWSLKTKKVAKRVTELLDTEPIAIDLSRIGLHNFLGSFYHELESC